VHISELAAHHVENPREVVAPGQHVVVKIIDIDADRRRLSLSMKRVSEHEPLLPPIALVPGDKPFLADEIAAEESGVPLPSLVSDSDAVFSDELTPEDEAALEFYASSSGAVTDAPEAGEEAPAVGEEAPAVEDDAPVASAETDEPADEAPEAEAAEDAGEPE